MLIELDWCDVVLVVIPVVQNVVIFHMMVMVVSAMLVDVVVWLRSMREQMLLRSVPGLIRGLILFQTDIIRSNVRASLNIIRLRHLAIVSLGSMVDGVLMEGNWCNVMLIIELMVKYFSFVVVIRQLVPVEIFLEVS